MKKISVYIVVIVLCTCCIRQTNTENQLKELSKIEKLTAAYKVCKQNGCEAAQKLEYLENFPNSFEEFNAFFGYVDSASPLYSEAHDYIEYFFQIGCEADSAKFSRKMINIGINGSWDADAMSYFQHFSEKFINENACYFVSQLAHYPKDDAKSFMNFMESSIHPDDPEQIAGIKAMQKSINSCDSDLFQE